MLSIVQWLIAPRLAALKQKGITAAAFREWIETHHQTSAKLRALAKRMRVHRHDPVRRIDPVVAAARAYIGVTRKNRAVQHEHVVAENEHLSIHRRGIRYPARAGALAAHRISNVDRRSHRLVPTM